MEKIRNYGHAAAAFDGVANGTGYTYKNQPLLCINCIIYFLFTKIFSCFRPAFDYLTYCPTGKNRTDLSERLWAYFDIFDNDKIIAQFRNFSKINLSQKGGAV